MKALFRKDRICYNIGVKSWLGRKESKPRFNSFDDLPTVLNAGDLAGALNISRATSYCLLRSADFPTLQIGRRLLVTRDSLLEWIKKQEK